MNLSRERLGAAVTLAVGIALSLATLADVRRHVVVEGHPLGLVALESAVPLAADLALIGAGVYLLSGRGSPAFARRSGAWTLAGGALVALFAGVVFAAHTAAGLVDSAVFLTHLAAVGGLFGLVAAYFSASRAERDVENERERNRLAVLFENSSDAIVETAFTDEGAVVADVNPAFERTFGYDADAIRGQSIDDLLAPGRTGEAEALSERARRGERVETVVERRTADGDERTFRLQALPVEAVGPRAPRSCYAIYTDRTDDERFLRQLTGLHDYTRRLMSLTDPEDVIEVAIPAADELLGFEVVTVFVHDAETGTLEPELLTDRTLELLGGEAPTLPVEGSVTGRVFREGERVVAADIRRDPDAANPDSRLRSEMLFPIDDYGVFVVASTEPDAFDDRDVALAEILADNVEAALTRATRETEVREQKERLDRFASVVSHDLRNPLHAARGYLDLAREDDDSEHLERVASALDRTDRLVDDLLALARSERTVDVDDGVDLGAVVREAWDHAETGSATLDVDGSLGVLSADPDRLSELLGNLFRNSAEHGSAGDRTSGDAITVTVGRTESGFYVADDGPGIDPEVRDSLFEEGVTTAADGTGFGLAIVRRIAEAHGWSVSVTDSDDGGARFEFDVDGRAEDPGRTQTSESR